jgi:hypothetical protein
MKGRAVIEGVNEFAALQNAKINRGVYEAGNERPGWQFPS